MGSFVVVVEFILDHSNFFLVVFQLLKKFLQLTCTHSSVL